MYALVKSSGDADDGLQASSSSASASASSSLPYAEPSTSWAHLSSSTARDTAVDSDDTDDDGHDNEECSAAIDDKDNSLDECDSDTIDDILSHYMYKRDIKCSEVSDRKRTSKSVIEYVNLNYLINNFRTIGLHGKFDITHIDDAQYEFQSFEKWFSNEKFIHGRKYINELRLPLFCHLYLCIYSKNKDHRDQLHKFLNTFDYIFKSSRGTVILEELNSFIDTNELSPLLLLFRQNRYMLSVTQEFLNILYEFFHRHFILKSVFQEWFDVNYITDEDALKVYEQYCNTKMSKLNTGTELNTQSENYGNPSGAFSGDSTKEKLQHINLRQSHSDRYTYSNMFFNHF